jgi:8-oxo-dGTP diphosphatase
MSKKPMITAAGAIVLREVKGAREVLVVHRPAYKDWSLPKGKPKTDEDLPATAVREVFEETGVRVHLGLPLGRTRYEVGKRTKQVAWWIGVVDSERRRRPDGEVDKAVWMPVEKAITKLTYPDEAKLLKSALPLESTGAVLLVRHGKAMLRKNWSGTDANRPVSARGRRQAKRLPALLAAYGCQEVLSSTSRRCLQTLRPYADSAGLPLTGVSLLSEEEAEGHEHQVVAFMEGLRRHAGRDSTVVAVCGHRPVLPAMRDGLGVPDKPMLTAETFVVHVNAEGEPLALEVLKPAF